MYSTGMGKRSDAAVVRPMEEGDLAAADRIFRLAFGTVLGLPDPEDFAAGRELIRMRWRASPESALAAKVDGTMAGSNILTRWGSFGFFGPLTIRPDLWNRRIAQDLLAATVDLFDRWGVRDAGLFTFAHSTGHVHLYQKFRFLTALLGKAVGTTMTDPPRVYSAMDEGRRAEVLAACRRLTDAIHPGLDVTGEIRSVQDQRLGETVVVWDGDSLDAFAVCHCGEGTEAGAKNCYIKFAAVQPGDRAQKAFGRLLDACEALASIRGLERVEAGVNLARSQAYRTLLEHGYRTAMQGVAMQRPDSPAFNRPGVFVLDDWR